MLKLGSNFFLKKLLLCGMETKKIARLKVETNNLTKKKGQM